MPAKTNSVPGAPCWIDLNTSNPDRSIDFYRQVLEWEATLGPAEVPGGYLWFSRGGHRIAGIRRRPAGSPGADSWSTYLLSTDARATAAAAAEAGGSVLVEPVDVPQLGWTGQVSDPSGAAIGVLQPAGHHGYEVYGEAGAAAWHEVHTTDYAASVAFYQKAFGWTTETQADTDDFRYAVSVHDGQQIAGIYDAARDLPPGGASAWQVYFGAIDVDQTVGKALEHGARLVEAPQDTPYGRLAGMTDVTGAYFKLIAVDA